MPAIKLGSWLKRLLTVDESELGHQFTLQQTLERPSSGESGTSAAEQTRKPAGEGPAAGEGSARESRESNDESENGVEVIRPVPLRQLVEQRAAERQADRQPAGQERTPRADEQTPAADPVEGRQTEGEEPSASAQDRQPIPRRLDEVHDRLKEVFHLPKNKDFVVRDFRVGTPGG
ncbi:MAG: hypothetical protein IRZ33_00775, partial [Alicyclobacillaceae bacterium]|nr:hypothetical protein [Alicyclobacillaceae bacterium]